MLGQPQQTFQGHVLPAPGGQEQNNSLSLTGGQPREGSSTQSDKDSLVIELASVVPAYSSAPCLPQFFKLKEQY